MGKNILIVVCILIALTIVTGLGYYFYGILQPIEDDDNYEVVEEEITKIVYSFSDASIPPEYHRSYTITMTKGEVHLFVNSYGNVLEDKKYDISESEFEAIAGYLDEYEIKNREENELDEGCTGGTSDTIVYYEGDVRKFEGHNYNCAGEKFGNLDGDVEGFANRMKELIPDLQSLLD